MGINRASADMEYLDDTMTNLFKADTTLSIDAGGVTRKCYSYGSTLDEEVCFTSRSSDAAQDAILSVQDHEDSMWGVHASQLGSNKNSKTDKYTDSHYALPLPQSGLNALSTYFTANSPYPITKSTRLAYA